MNEAPKKGIFSPEEMQRLVAFFSILIEIDKQERITPTAKRIYKEETAHG